MTASPAAAVDSEMLGRLKLDALASPWAAIKDCCSLGLGETEKSWLRRFPLDWEGRLSAAVFSDKGGLAELVNGSFMLRGMSKTIWYGYWNRTVRSGGRT